MQGEVFMLVGATGSGKTYFTRQMLTSINPKSCLTFDVNNEWPEHNPYPIQNGRFWPDMDIYLEKAMKLSNSVLILEDATSFFAVQGRSDLLVKILVARRHTGNTSILLFHSFGDVPRYLFRKVTAAVVIFKTEDNENDVLRLGKQKVFDAWKRVQMECEGHQFFSTNPPPPGIAPPSEIVLMR